ncbi:MAG: hypothetical protein FJY77_00180 [Candidatus Altiarchaeales archaeon]|nr:hypothetical protein [Candidatus Altiarchaeales archaeon]
MQAQPEKRGETPKGQGNIAKAGEDVVRELNRRKKLLLMAADGKLREDKEVANLDYPQLLEEIMGRFPTTLSFRLVACAGKMAVFSSVEQLRKQHADWIPDLERQARERLQKTAKPDGKMDPALEQKRVEALVLEIVNKPKREQYMAVAKKIIADMRIVFEKTKGTFALTAGQMDQVYSILKVSGERTREEQAIDIETRRMELEWGFHKKGAPAVRGERVFVEHQRREIFRRISELAGKVKREPTVEERQDIYDEVYAEDRGRRILHELIVGENLTNVDFGIEVQKLGGLDAFDRRVISEAKEVDKTDNPDKLFRVAEGAVGSREPHTSSLKAIKPRITQLWNQ